MKRRFRQFESLLLAALLLVSSVPAGPYVTETSGIRWNDVGGIRWNDVGGIRWNDVGGIRWNDVGGIRWNDVGGTFFINAQGIRWNDVGGIRWNDVGGLSFDPPAGGGITLGLDLLDQISALPDTGAVNVVISYQALPTQPDLDALTALGVAGGTRFRQLPMLAVNATKQQISQIATLPGVRSIFSNKSLGLLDQESAALIGLPELADDAATLTPLPGGILGRGVTIAVIDTGVDATHPDLPMGTKVEENVQVTGQVAPGPGFIYPMAVEGVANTDTVLGHGTFVASVAAGSGAGSGGLYQGIAPQAKILSLSAGDFFILHVLEAFDYILDNQSQYNVRIVNCSWGTSGWFDPEDPVNIATRALYDAGVTVVFAAGNMGPAPDTLNPYSVAPWVIGVGSTRKDGRLSEYSSRGIHEELLYHPTLVAPGEAIIAARAGTVNTVPGVGQPAPVPPPHDQLYTSASGTSFSAPHVAGTIALMLEVDPSLTPAEIKKMVQETSAPLLVRDRFEVGSGRLDAWAAVQKVHDPGRAFGLFVPDGLDTRPYRIDHDPGVESTHLLTALGTLTIPVTLPVETSSWQATLAWGGAPGLADLEVRVLDAGGNELGASGTLNGLGLFGRTEGLHLDGDLPQTFDLEVSFRPGTGLQDQPFSLRQESARPVVTAYSDVAALPTPDRWAVTRAVAARAMMGRSGIFDPAVPILRGELARSIALIAAVPQRVPAGRSFIDVPATDDSYPYIESVSGTRAWRRLMEPKGGNRFRPELPARRVDVARALVRTAQLEAEALARTGEVLPLADGTMVPSALRGYVAVALEQGILEIQSSASGPIFNPYAALPRQDAAASILRTMELLDAAATWEGRAAPVGTTGTPGGGGGGPVGVLQVKGSTGGGLTLP